MKVKLKSKGFNTFGQSNQLGHFTMASDWELRLSGRGLMFLAFEIR